MGLFHPSIVAPIAAGVEGTLAYLAQEYVAAESLDVAMRHYAPAPLDKALPYVTQLAGAVDFARAAGVSHGTLHPRDVFVTPDEARATGFGIATVLHRVGIRAPVRRPYSAPERIEGADWGTAADVFSLAAITFELLTGRRVVGAGDEAAAMLGELGDAADPQAVRSVLSAALAADPAQRPPSALAFAAALESALRGQEAAEVQDKPDATPPRRRRVKEQTPVAAVPATLAESHPLFDTVADEDVSAASSTDERTAPVEPAPIRAASPDTEAHAGPSLGETPVEIEPEPLADRFVTPALAAVDSMQPSDVPAPAIIRETAPPALERVRPGMAAIAATLMVGLVAGFLAGYAVGARGRPAPRAATSASTPPSAPPGPSSGGREWSESAVEAPPVPSEGGAAGQPRTGASGGVVAANPRDAASDVSRAAHTPEASQAGRVLVRSSPAGAQVTIDGRARGVTPLAVRDLAYGTYTVKVARAGYRPETRRVTVSGRRPAASLTIDLRREATPAATTGEFVGSIYIDSRPRGARVLVDSRPVGTTPLLLSELRAGSHVVRIEQEGYRPWSSSVRVVAGERGRVTASLERVIR